MIEILKLSTPHGALGTAWLVGGSSPNPPFNSTRCIRNIGECQGFVMANMLSTPHGALGTQNTTRARTSSGSPLSTPHGALGTAAALLLRDYVPNPFQLHTVH